jgi:hypothetical protein
MAMKKELYIWELQGMDSHYYRYIHFLVEGPDVYELASYSQLGIVDFETFYKSGSKMSRAEGRAEWTKLVGGCRYKLIEKERQ